MQRPVIPQKPRMRIDTTKKWEMLIVAGLFDLFTLLPKLFVVVGVAGALTVGWIPFFGQIVGLAAIGATTALNFMFTWLFMFVGYTWMWGWLLTRDVPIFGGHKLEKKALILPLTVLVDMMPLIGTLLPGISVWTYTQIRFAQQEDKERHARAVRRAHAALRAYEAQLERRAAQEQQFVQQIAAQEALMVAHAANDNVPVRAAHDNRPRSTPPLTHTQAQSPYGVARAA